MASSNRHKRGYTFTEILIVMAIIGILVALLLPAVQAAREAARRLNCSKNLEQLIIAVQNYESLHRVYPPGTINETGPILSVPQGYHHNWLIQILPFIEEKTTYEHVDDLVGVYHANNAPVRKLAIEIYRCPSSPVYGKGYCNYAGVHNDIEAPIDVTNNGTFFLNSSVSYFDLKDGSSNTLFIGEKEIYQGDLGWMSGTRATLRNTGIRINAVQGSARANRRHWPRPINYAPGFPNDWIPTDEMLSDETTLDTLYGDSVGRKSNFNSWSVVDQRLIVSDEDFEIGEEMYGSPSGMSGEGPAEEFLPVEIPQDARLAVGGFGSQHPGGAQFAKGDGSVQFLSETIDANVFLQLGHRADGRMTSGW